MPRRKKEGLVPEEKLLSQAETTGQAVGTAPEAALPGAEPAAACESAAVRSEASAACGPEAAAPPPRVAADLAGGAASEPQPVPVPPPGVAPPATPPVAGPTSEERWAAAVAHSSILLNLMTGILGPVVALLIWLLYERKSRYVAWHALQALVFQAVTLVLVLALGAVAGLLWALVVPLMAVVIGCCLAPFALGFTLITAALLIGSLIYGCVGALTVLEGRDFRYRWVADYIPPLGQP